MILFAISSAILNIGGKTRAVDRLNTFCYDFYNFTGRAVRPKESREVKSCQEITTYNHTTNIIF